MDFEVAATHLCDVPAFVAQGGGSEKQPAQEASGKSALKYFGYFAICASVLQHLGQWTAVALPKTRA